MSKKDDILFTINAQLTELTQFMATYSQQQNSVIDNYDILLSNQTEGTNNHDILVQNQLTIIKNQGIITQNQSSIINNQSVIVKNQAFLKTLIDTQTSILAIISNRPKTEILEEVQDYLEKAQKEIAEGFELPL
jgi:hypothetical protein